MLNKTDKADSEALSRYGYTAKLIIWQPEPENVRFLKALLWTVPGMSETS